MSQETTGKGALLEAVWAEIERQASEHQLEASVEELAPDRGMPGQRFIGVMVTKDSTKTYGVMNFVDKDLAPTDLEFGVLKGGIGAMFRGILKTIALPRTSDNLSIVGTIRRVSLEPVRMHPLLPELIGQIFLAPLRAAEALSSGWKCRAQAPDGSYRQDSGRVKAINRNADSFWVSHALGSDETFVPDWQPGDTVVLD